jgi:hypothetical protein
MLFVRLLPQMRGLDLLVHGALSYQCMRTSATSVCGLELLVYDASSTVLLLVALVTSAAKDFESEMF